jgi:hypothetical protein
MSEVFEGVICPGEREALSPLILRSAGPLALAIEELTTGICVAYREDARAQAAFAPAIETLAAELAKHLQWVLLVRYDSRIGHRSSAIFKGRTQSAFGDTDELYVPLDESGMPVLSAQPLHVDALRSDEEYETVKNAIQLGLDVVGVNQWERLFTLMTR